MIIDPIFQEALQRGFKGTWSHPDPVNVALTTDYAVVGKQVAGFPQTIWQLSKHTLEWAWLIVTRLKGQALGSEDQGHNFFPVELAPSETDWQEHLKSWTKLELELGELIKNTDPSEQIAEWGDSTFADSLLILLTHNSYHTAQIVMLRRLLGDWKQE